MTAKIILMPPSGQFGTLRSFRRRSRTHTFPLISSGFIKAMKASSGGNQAGQEPSNGQLEREASSNETQKSRSRRSQAEK